MKFTRNDCFLFSIASGIVTGILAFFLDLDPFYYFWFGISIAYLNLEGQDRFWTWWRSQPPFKGFKYWWSIAKEHMKF